MNTLWIDCLRHGEVMGKQKYRGITDDPVSEKGWQAMQTVTKGKTWQYIISSPLQRCATFARYYAKANLTSLQLNHNFQEYNFGDWDGLTIKEIEQKGQQALLHRFWKNPHSNPPPNAEKIGSFNHRVQQGWQTLVTEMTQKPNQKQMLMEEDTRILLITHAGVVRSLVSSILAIPSTHQMRLSIPLASITCFRIDYHQQEHHVCLHSLGLT